MKNGLRILIFVLVMGTVSGALLVGINSWTAPLIAKNEELRLKSSILNALEIAYRPENIFDTFDRNIKFFVSGGQTFYKSGDGATAFEFRGPGLWGPIAGIVGINADKKSIRTIKILHQEETPGLGGRIAEDDFLRQFRGKEFVPKIIFTAQGKAAASNEVDSITGATGSSKALEKLLNETLQKCLKKL